MKFFIGGDFNKVCIDDLLESNGALKQICSVATRDKNTLELVITSMATLFYPPTTLKPLAQDENSKGKPADHNIVIIAPKADLKYKVERHKTTIHVRPQPKSRVSSFMLDLGTHNWHEVISQEDPHDKASQFHNTMITLLNKHLPVKTVKMSSLDKKWFNPALKLLYISMQKEFFKNRKSQEWKSLRSKFRKAKRKATKVFYQNFVSELKTTKPAMFFKMAKQIGAADQTKQSEIKIECIENLTAQEQVQAVADSMAEVSNLYKPVDLSKLPSYLPANKAPQVEVYKCSNKFRTKRKHIVHSKLIYQLPYAKKLLNSWQNP